MSLNPNRIKTASVSELQAAAQKLVQPDIDSLKAQADANTKTLEELQRSVKQLTEQVSAAFGELTGLKSTAKKAIEQSNHAAAVSGANKDLLGQLTNNMNRAAQEAVAKVAVKVTEAGRELDLKLEEQSKKLTSFSKSVSDTGTSLLNQVQTVAQAAEIARERAEKATRVLEDKFEGFKEAVMLLNKRD